MSDLTLTKRTIIVWASEEDMNGNTFYIQARANQLSGMIANNLTDGVGTKTDPATGSIKFIDDSSANSWISFVSNLASEYNKTIISTEITSV